MGRTFASKNTKATLLAMIAPGLTSLGYRLHAQDPATVRTDFRRELNTDVSVSLSLDFFDGPLAGASIARLDAVLGIASKKLLAIYSKLHNGISTADFFPISAPLRSMAPVGREGSWFFELPDKTNDVQAFIDTAKGPLESLISDYDSAEKQVQKLLDEQHDGIYWNDAYFEPVAQIYLGAFSAARSAAEKVLARPAAPSFIAAYKAFYANVLRADAQLEG